MWSNAFMPVHGRRFALPGQLSWLEREIHDFQKYLAQRLAPDTQRG